MNTDYKDRFPGAFSVFRVLLVVVINKRSTK
jgi:hypothetical protein